MPSAVLVAEPELETREFLGRQLRDDGFDVLDAARRSEALELAESARPDVVLLAELELCLRLRRGEPGRTWDRNVPVIVLASSSDPVERVRALDRGADDVVGTAVRLRRAARAHPRADPAHAAATEDVIVAGDLVIDRPTRRVHVRDTAVAPLGEGVRARREARVAAVSRLDEGGAACATSGDSVRSVAPARWSRMRRACGRSSASVRTTASS